MPNATAAPIIETIPPPHPPPHLHADSVEAKLISRHHWNDALMSLRIARDPGFRFTPGQFARIGLRDAESGKMIWRAYSIVSGPDEDFLEFFLVVLPNGEFSQRVARLRIGDPMVVEGHAQGFLTLDRFVGGNDAWLIATGTGLAPYISMLRTASTWTRFERIVLVYSARQARDLGYLDELRALSESRAAGRARLSVIKTLTRETDDAARAGVAPSLSGRVTMLFEHGATLPTVDVALDQERSRFMLCGNPDMVESMRALLKGRGFRMNRRLEPGHIIVENYW